MGESTNQQAEAPAFGTLREFYPYYLEEHRNRLCRRMHFIGSTLVIFALLAGLILNWRYLLLMPFLGYGFAWLGHMIFEKNRPATFKYPVYSFLSDWVMYRDILVGKIKA